MASDSRESAEIHSSGSQGSFSKKRTSHHISKKVKNLRTIELRELLSSTFDFPDDLDTEQQRKEYFKLITHYFLLDIFRFAECVCGVCEKLFFRKQVKEFKNLSTESFTKVAHNYLPSELKSKKSVYMCDRCEKYLKDEANKVPPSRAYWNSMRPGAIPKEISDLSVLEKQMLRRVSPFLRIERPVRYGQFGFKGQAMYFPRNFDEVQEKILSKLPRPIEDSNIAVITEETERFSKCPYYQQFIIRLDETEAAYNWLKKNNELYADTTFDREIAEHNETHQESVYQRIDTNEWKRINSDSTDTILFGEECHSAHALLKNKFKDNTLGAHFFPIAVAAIGEVVLAGIDKFNKTIINLIITKGTNLLYFYRQQLSTTDSADTLATINNFIATISDKSFLHDPVTKTNVNYSNFSEVTTVSECKLLTGKLELFFSDHSYGIVLFSTTTKCESFAIFASKEYFYVYLPMPLTKTARRSLKSTAGSCGIIRTNSAPSLAAHITRLTSYKYTLKKTERSFSIITFCVNQLSSQNQPNLFDLNAAVRQLINQNITIPKSYWDKKPNHDILKGSSTFTNLKYSDLKGNQSYIIAVSALTRFIDFKDPVNPEFFPANISDQVIEKGSELFRLSFSTLYAAIEAKVKSSQNFVEEDIIFVTVYNYEKHLANEMRTVIVDKNERNKYQFKYEKAFEGLFETTSLIFNTAKTFKSNIKEFFAKYQYGILSFYDSRHNNVYSLALVKHGDTSSQKYYIFVPEALTPTGQLATGKGTAAFLRYKNEDQLYEYCKKFKKVKNSKTATGHYIIQAFSINALEHLTTTIVEARPSQASSGFSTFGIGPEWELIGDTMRILFAGFHQGNIPAQFSGSIYGNQCTGMATTAIIYCMLSRNLEWTTKEFQNVIIAGDRFYQFILDHYYTKSRPNFEQLSRSNYMLHVKNLLLNKNIRMFGQVFQLHHPETNHSFLGNLVTVTPELLEAVPNAKNLMDTLRMFSIEPTFVTALIIIAATTRSIIKANGQLYLFDSHVFHNMGSTSLSKVAGVSIKPRNSASFTLFTSCDLLAEYLISSHGADLEPESRNERFDFDVIFVRQPGQLSNEAVILEVDDFQPLNSEQQQQRFQPKTGQQSSRIEESSDSDSNMSFTSAQSGYSSTSEIRTTFSSFHIQSQSTQIQLKSWEPKVDNEKEFSYNILYANFHQSNSDMFKEYAGNLCLPITIISFIKAALTHPSKWSNFDMNDLFPEAIKYHQECSARRIRPGSDKMLALEDLIKDEVHAYSRIAKITIELVKSVEGRLDNRYERSCRNLQEACEIFCDGKNQFGVFNYENHSRAVMMLNKDLYVLESNPVNKHGMPGTTYSTDCAAIFHVTSVDHLVLLLEKLINGSSSTTVSSRKSNEFFLYAVECVIAQRSPSKSTKNVIPSENIAIQKNASSRTAVYTLTSFPVKLTKKLKSQKPTHFDDDDEDDVDDIDPETKRPNMQQFAFMDADANIPAVKEYLINRSTVTKQVEEIIAGEEVQLQDLKLKQVKPVDLFKTPFLEELAFFDLFPFGRFGLHYNKRKVNITTLDYFKCRLLGSDLRFQRLDYLFFALSIYEALTLRQKINVMGNLREGSKTARIANVHLNFRDLRGTSAYWKKSSQDLLAMIRTLGTATFFITLSCNDLNWPDFITAYLIAKYPNLKSSNISDQMIHNLSSNDILEMTRECPVILVRQFMRRVYAMIQLMKDEAKGIFGSELKDYWWRIEYQLRGSPHLHMLIWLKDFPEYKSPEYAIRLDKIVTCKLPESGTDLYHLVNECQRHRHSFTCYKGRKDNSKKCRFGFPRPISDQSEFFDIENEKELFNNNGRIYKLKRQLGEENINNYNSLLLQCWGANLDIQPCGDGIGIAYYIAKYASKAEPDSIDEITHESIKLMQAKRDNTEIGKEIFKLSMNILRKRQVSSCEAAQRLIGCRMKSSTRTAVFVNARRREECMKMVMINIAGKDNSTTMSITDRYYKRPKDAFHENMCLAEFAMLYAPVYAKQKKRSAKEEEEDLYEEEVPDEDMMEDEPEEYEPQPKKPHSDIFINGDGKKAHKEIRLLDTKMIMRARKHLAVIKTPYFNFTKESEKYFFSVLMLYIPHRNENELLADKSGVVYATSREAFDNKKHLIEKTQRGYFNIAREVEMAIEQLAMRVEADETDQNFEDMGQGGNEDDLFFDNDDQHSSYEERTESAHARDVKNMNKEQRFILEAVKSRIDVEVAAGDQLLKSPLDPMRVFITGGPGCGKTYLLKLIVETINRKFRNQSNPDVDYVKVCAPSGVAATLINGRTIHSLLKVPVSKTNKQPPFMHLTGIFLEELVSSWQNVRFFILDECSMVSYEMLSYIDRRLREIKRVKDTPFGNLNVLIFGDLLQLPPVNGHLIYKKSTEAFSKFSIDPVNLWHLLQLYELKQNMRQKEDQTFVQLLNSMREGKLLPEHVVLLQAKFNNSKGEGEFRPGGPALRVYPTNDMVNAHNQLVVASFKDVEKFTVVAFDRLVEMKKELNATELESVTPTDIRQTGGFLKSIEIFVSARVMLRRNMFNMGLANGNMGTITRIIWRFGNKQINRQDFPELKIQFDRIDGEKTINAMSVEFDAKKGYGVISRTMLPIVICYAVTVHKLQGSTIPRAVVYLGKKIFAPGQAYVAISRVQSLEGLELDPSDFSEKVLEKINQDGKVELERMREQCDFRFMNAELTALLDQLLETIFNRPEPMEE